MSSASPKDINVIIQRPEPPVLQNGHELVGVLESVEPVGDGFLWIRIAGMERLVAEELGEQLRGLTGKKVSIMRVGDQWSAVEVPA